jgi:ribulose-5-phosphate 4-epimerase/fuculose-1-phosphate aldolase
MEQGQLKFNCEWIPAGPIQAAKLELINYWRNTLHQRGLIGVYPNGISFGNISIRAESGGQFIITGTGTGGLEFLEAKHYTTVVHFDFEKNSLSCFGPIKASAESLTHAAIYRSNFEIKAVIHIHNLSLWESLRHKFPTTSPDAEYGTPEMAYEIGRLFAETDVLSRKVLVMGGHREGIVAFGKDLDEAGNVIINLLVELGQLLEE